MKVLLILVDGMRPDALPQVAAAQRIIRQSAACLNATSVIPPVTLPCHISLFHSVDPERHGTTTNIYAPQVRPIDGQIDDLIGEINVRSAKNERVLVTTLTKKMAEDLTTYLLKTGIRVRYMHADIGAMERMEIIRDLRMAKFDVLVGINLLREGLDLPEVSLVAILDADKEGFLRSETSLIQTIGRAARNADGKVIMYADNITPSMAAAMDETARRREIQDAYNQANGIVPKTIIKSVRDLIEISSPTAERKGRTGVKMTKAEKEKEIARLEKQMKEAARMMEYEYAAILRDQIIELRGNGL